MKKLLSAVCLLLLCFSCKKSNSPDVEKDVEKYDVKFSVADFNQEVVDMGTGTGKGTLAVGDTLKNYADILYYRIYDADGKPLNSTDQYSSAPTFGTITDKLASGTYNVFFAASKGQLLFADSKATFNNAVYGYSTNTAIYWYDTFSKQIKITVGTTAINQQVRLERALGAVEVTIEDAIPANVYKFTVNNKSDFRFLQVDGSVYQGGSEIIKSFGVSQTEIGQKGKKLLSYVANTTKPLTFVVRAWDKDDHVIAEKTITNVTCYKNKKTLLTGNLFTSASNALGFPIVVDPLWGTPTTPIKF